MRRLFRVHPSCLTVTCILYNLPHGTSALLHMCISALLYICLTVYLPYCACASVYMCLTVICLTVHLPCLTVHVPLCTCALLYMRLTVPVPSLASHVPYCISALRYCTYASLEMCPTVHDCTCASLYITVRCFTVHNYVPHCICCC